MRLLHWVLFLALSVSSWAAESNSFTVSEFKFEAPADWKVIPVNSSMRKAQLSVPGAAAGQDAGEVVFFHFGPSSGGGTQANVERWLGQFVEPRSQIGSEVESETLGGRKVTYVQAKGTYKSGLPGQPFTPKKDYRLLGAIIEGEQGSVIIRFTGPAALVEKNRDAFKKMIASGVKAEGK